MGDTREFRSLLALDIETVSNGKRAKQWVESGLTIKHGNTKDPLKIAAKELAAKEEANKKHGLHWITGQIIVVSMEDVFSGEKMTIHGSDEKILLKEVAAYTERANLIGKNSKTFDFPFLVGRYLANGMEVPAVFRDRNRTKDVDEFFGFSSASTQSTKLDGYAHGMFLDAKSMHGSKVQGVYDEIMEGKPELWHTLIEYCEGDAHIVAEMARLYYGGDYAGSIL